jgi:hypothetical protein
VRVDIHLTHKGAGYSNGESKSITSCWPILLAISSNINIGFLRNITYSKFFVTRKWNVKAWQRAVIKVGSSLIAPDGNQCSAQYLLAIAQFITASRVAGKEVILVSSGSVAAGRTSLNLSHRASIVEKQAMAAIGQTRMMANWQRFF